MRKETKTQSKLKLCRESIQIMEGTVKAGIIVGPSGEDCTVQFRNCHFTAP